MKFKRIGFAGAAVFREDRWNTNRATIRFWHILWQLIYKQLKSCSKQFLWLDIKKLQIPLTMKHFMSCYL